MKGARIMKKLLLIVLSTLLLTSCTSSSSTLISASRDFAPVTIADSSCYMDRNIGVFDYEKLAKKTGVDVSYKGYMPLEMTTKILAGDSDVDIYVLTSTNVRQMMSKGAYLPIKSEIISDFVGDCFSCMRELCFDSDGQLAVMPVYFNVNAVLVPKDAVNELNITYEQIEYLDDYIDYIRNYTGDRKCYGSTYMLYWHMVSQYDFNINDLPNGKVNYDTDVFRGLMSTLLDGWESNYDSNWYTENLILHTDVTDKALFIPHYLPQFTDVYKNFWDDYRAFPMPKLNEDITNEPSNARFLYINPNSENKEAALKMMEYIAENYYSLIGGNGYGNLLFENVEKYPESVKTDSEAFADYVRIVEGSKLETYVYLDSSDYYMDYHKGILTMDEAIEERTRQIVMWLNE